MKKKTFFITTPIYYASGPLHIGHLYCTIVTWMIVNYKRVMGYDVKFLTGSDEHGQKIQNKAIKAKKEPQKFVDDLVTSYKKMWKDWNIDYDFFSRTTDEYHCKTVQNVFSWYLKNDFIYKGKYEGLYSIEDEEFFTKSQAVLKDGEYFHPTSGHKLTSVSEESYFFRIKKLEKWWLEKVKKNPEWLQPKKMTNEIINNFFKEGLNDLSVTRDNFDWGIPIKENKKHILYVWLDALFNYITKLGFDLEKPEPDFKKYWKEGDEIVHIIGKEIARFHFIYWTIFLEALGLRQPTKIFAHGLIRDKDGRKMSKSLGNAVQPEYLLEKYHDEMIKYYFASQVIFGEDSNFDEDKLIDIINANLINNYGNLVSRTLKMINNSFESGVVYKNSTKKIHKDIDQKIKEFPKEFIKEMDAFKFDKGFGLAIELSSQLNKYIDLTTPWKLTDNKKELELILSRLLNGIYAVSWALQIVMPRKIKEVAEALNIKEFKLSEVDNFNKFDNIKTADKFIFFKRIKK